MKLSINILANFIGKVWIAGIGLLLVPIYIKLMGIESYGLVGFYGALLGSMSILDMGLSTTLNRELAKSRIEQADPKKVRDMVFTIESIYWLVGLTIALLVVLLAPAIATHWLKVNNLPKDEVKKAIMLMGAVIAFQWPISLYNGGMTGLEKQVTDNTIMICMSTIRSAGVLLLLWLVSPTISTFFIWQAVTSFLYVIAMRTGLWHYLPKSKSATTFSFEELKRIWRFAAGLTSIGVVSFFLSQGDKIILSKILPLEEFAYYMLAFNVASGLYFLSSPITTAIFPRLTLDVVAKDQESLLKSYHNSCRMVASVILPVALILIFFARDILLIWTKSVSTTEHSATIMQILVIGSAVNNLIVVPYMLLIAHGNTRYTFYQNLIASIILIPMLFWWVHVYGPIGGAFVWLSVNIGYIFISIPLIHKKIFNNFLKDWYFKNVLKPLLPPLFIIIAIKLLSYFFSIKTFNLVGVIGITISIIGFSLMFYLRKGGIQFIKSIKVDD